MLTLDPRLIYQTKSKLIHKLIISSNMIRNFNYTDRKRILRENISFEWIDGKGEEPASFLAKIDLHSAGLIRSDGQVWVEACSGSIVSRYYFGTVEHPEYPEDTRLTSFPRGLKPTFKIKVVDPKDPRKRLLAFADRIAPSEREEIESGRQSILPVEYVDLGQKIWNLRIDDSLMPILQLNSTITDPVGISTLAKSPEFVALVYPAVIRQILSYLLLETEDPSMIAEHDWINYGSNLTARHCPDRDTYGDNEEDFARDARIWIDDVVGEFCNVRLTRDTYVAEKTDNQQNG